METRSRKRRRNNPPEEQRSDIAALNAHPPRSFPCVSPPALVFPSSPTLFSNASLSPQSKLASLTPFLSEVFASKHFFDLTILVENRSFTAHRLVLCAASPPFRAMLMGVMREARQETITLEGVRSDMFELWLEFVYGRDVVLTNENVMGLLELAVMFDISDLRDQCCQALEAALNDETAWVVLEAADRWQLTDLRARSLNFVLNSFHQLTSNTEAASASSPGLGFDRTFLNASLGVVAEVIGSDFLNASSEMQVFEQATRWLGHRICGPPNADHAASVETILSLVRYPFIPPALLMNHVLSHPLLKSSSLQRAVHHSVKISQLPAAPSSSAQSFGPPLVSVRGKRDRRRVEDPAPVASPRTPFTCKYDLKNCLRGHTDSVCALKVFRDWLFSGGSDNSVIVWDLTRVSCVTTLREHTDMVLGLDVWVQQRGSGGNVGCRTRSGHRRVGTVTSEKAEVFRLVSCSDDETIRVWNTSDWSVERCLTGHHAGVNAVMVVGGNRLYSGSKDRLIKVWQLGGRWECIATLEGHQDGVLALAQVGNKVVSAADDWTVRVWDCESHACERVLAGHGDAVLALLVVGSRLLSASVEIKVWDTTQWTCEHTVRGHEGGVFGLASAGNKLFSASEDGSVKVWDVSSLTCLHTLSHHRDAVFAVAVHNNRLITASADLDIIVWS